MATNTSNLALTKAADGEAYSVSVVNQNLQKIDDFAGDLIHENKGSVSSLSALSSLLDTVLVALGNNKTKTFIVGISTSFAPFGAATYSCTIYKFSNDTTYSHAILRRADTPYVYHAARNTNGWSYVQLQELRNWTAITGVSENTEFQVPTQYNEIFIEAAFSAGQRLCFYLVPTTRHDSGFYYNASANGAGAVSFAGNKKLVIYHPYYGGAATTYSSIKVWGR